MPQYAAVDIGSNSLRLLVAEASLHEPLPRLTRIAEDREVTRLGQSVFSSGKVDQKSIDNVCRVLTRMRGLYQQYEIAGVRVVATSAIRDTSNQAEFLTQASAAVGAPVEIISGQEEARLIHLGVQAVWPHPDQRVLIVDVGGGSAELIASDRGRIETAFSRPLGAVRLQSVFLQDDPPQQEQLLRLRSFIQEKLAVTLPKLSDQPYDRLISTSASAAAIVSAVSKVPRTRRDTIDRRRASTAAIRKLYRDLAAKPLAQRRRTLGIGPRRAEIIVPGIAVFLSVLETFHLPAMHYCAAGVRDGIIADLALRRVGHERSTLSPEQRRVVQALARRYGVDVRHSRKIVDFGHSLFQSLAALHRLPPYFGKLLEAACYLANVGHYISDTSHHKHSQYVIVNSDLAGFTQAERGFLALLCRYHRKALPGARHADFQALAPEARRALLLLVPLLRLAIGLDRAEEPHVHAVSAELTSTSVTLTLRAHGDTGLEQWALERVSEPFRLIYRRSLSVKVERA